MDTIIIGQGYNLEDNSSVGEELIGLFKSRRFSTLTCLVAFASYRGVSALSDSSSNTSRSLVFFPEIFLISQPKISNNGSKNSLRT